MLPKCDDVIAYGFVFVSFQFIINFFWVPEFLLEASGELLAPLHVAAQLPPCDVPLAVRG